MINYLSRVLFIINFVNNRVTQKAKPVNVLPYTYMHTYTHTAYNNENKTSSFEKKDKATVQIKQHDAVGRNKTFINLLLLTWKSEISGVVHVAQLHSKYSFLVLSIIF